MVFTVRGFVMLHYTQAYRHLAAGTALPESRQ
jgi:hypothetical protein